LNGLVAPSRTAHVVSTPVRAAVARSQVRGRLAVVTADNSI